VETPSQAAQTCVRSRSKQPAVAARHDTGRRRPATRHAAPRHESSTRHTQPSTPFAQVSALETEVRASLKRVQAAATASDQACVICWEVPQTAIEPTTPVPELPCALPPSVFLSRSSVASLQEPRAVLFLPCKHRCCCEGCAAEPRACPLCKATINERMRIFG
jgi:hypothetical protein